ncbi:MAG: DNA repair protein RecO [Prochlorococcus sp. SP3034]|nr:DNA repair protein RecO [Prochlorococcus sp. SP3034]|tara:strand:- start:8534 stop:9313 length:780 start_codon:yes stop_codon:yes gene_type:complete
MSSQNRLRGLCIKASPLGENDRLLTILSEEKGITRLAARGARRPKSSLIAATPITLLELQIFGRKNLKTIRQMKIIKSYNGIGKSIACLSAAQAITEITFLLVGNDDAQNNYLSTVLIHLDRIYDHQTQDTEDIKILSICIQSIVHLLAIGGISLPLHFCCKTGRPINPPLGNWDWFCNFIPNEGFTPDDDPNSLLKINASEMALLQRLLFSELPIKSNGDLLGPKKVWLRLLTIIESWINSQLGKELSSLKIIRELYK